MADKCIVNNTTQIIFNVIGGILTIVIVELVVKKIFTFFRLRKFKRFFGEDALNNDFYFSYDLLGLPKVFNQEGKELTYPYIKPGEESSGTGFSMERPVSSCTLRAIKYLTQVVGVKSKCAPILASDIDLKGRLDISFVSIGGPLSNFKTRDALENKSNDLIDFNNIDFTNKRTNKFVINKKIGFDYSLILKIYPNQFPDRTWFVCAGIAEWGSSGAAWYLSNKWRKILKYAGDSQFAIIVKVKPGQDESAEPVFKMRK